MRRKFLNALPLIILTVIVLRQAAKLGVFLWYVISWLF
jgi:hypothetical protein